MPAEIIPQIAQHSQDLTFTFQMFFNVVIGFVSFIGGVAMNRLFVKLDRLTDEDEKLGNTINELSITLPSKYVMKEDLRRLGDALFEKLDKMDSKLDRKQDK